MGLRVMVPSQLTQHSDLFLIKVNPFLDLVSKIMVVILPGARGPIGMHWWWEASLITSVTSLESRALSNKLKSSLFWFRFSETLWISDLKVLARRMYLLQLYF